MAEFDIVSKQLFKDFPVDFVRFVLGRDDASVLDIVDTEQPTVESHRTDSLARVRLDDVEILVHTEFQTSDSTLTPMPIRMAGYIGWLVENYRLPVYASVIYLRPDAGERDPGSYSHHVGGKQFRCEYSVIRLIETSGQTIIDHELWGLLPFAPLMQPPQGTDAQSWLRQCVSAANQLPFDAPKKSNFLTDLALLSGLVYNYETITDIISEETMFESVVAQKLAERSILQGERKRGIQDLLDVLEIRFDESNISALKPTIEVISDLQILRQLHREAVRAATLDDFQQFFDSIVENNS